MNLDSETVQGYWLTVVASDNGLERKHAVLHVYVDVVDVNDHRPQVRHGGGGNGALWVGLG